MALSCSFVENGEQVTLTSEVSKLHEYSGEEETKVEIVVARYRMLVLPANKNILLPLTSCTAVHRCPKRTYYRCHSPRSFAPSLCNTDVLPNPTRLFRFIAIVFLHCMTRVASGWSAQSSRQQRPGCYSVMVSTGAGSSSEAPGGSTLWWRPYQRPLLWS